MVSLRTSVVCQTHRGINWVVWLKGIWMDRNIQVFVHYIEMAMIVSVEDAWNDNAHVCAMWGMLQLLRHRMLPMYTRNTFTNNVDITAEIQMYLEGRTQ